MSRRGRHEENVHPGCAHRCCCTSKGAAKAKRRQKWRELDAPLEPCLKQQQTKPSPAAPGACLLEGHQLRNRHFGHHGIVVCGKRAGRSLQA